MKTYTGVSIGLLLGLVLFGLWGDAAAQTADPSSGDRGGEFVGLSPAQAKQLRRRIESTVWERGELESADTVEIQSQVQGPTTILRLVPEGTVVRAGDLLVELDDSALRETLIEQQATMAQARATLKQSEPAMAAAEQELASGLAVAELAAKVAKLNRDRYLAEGGEFELEVKRTESEMAVAVQKLEVAQNALKSTEKAVKKGLATGQAVDEAQLAVAEARHELVTADATRQLLTGRLRDYRTAVLELAVLQANSTLTRARSQSRLALENARADCLAGKAVLELEQARLVAVQRQIEGCRIRAPRAGPVIAADPPIRGSAPIEEGAVVRQGQMLLKMPDMSRLRLRVFVHESRIDRVRKGQPVRIRFDAFPDRTFGGKVVRIADFPEPVGWLRTDARQYAVLVSLEGAAPEMKLGMTAEAEIDVSVSDP